MTGAGSWEEMFEILARVNENADDCDCGAIDATRSHTISPGNPTGHAVDCPVFARWQEEVKLQTTTGASNADTAGRRHRDARRT